MSKNHPTDNIYSILDKLDALKPTPQEKHDSKVQQIRESVESQGSILKGLREVGSVEQRLAKQFAESKIEKDNCSKCDCDPCECTTNESTCNECGMYESKCKCESTNEDMSRAAKGYKKYGPEGMPALAKAGREGASEKEMDAIRKKYNRYDEGETTHTGGEKVATKTGTLHKSKATVDTERDVMTDKRSDPDADDAPKAEPKTKAGRGRPTKASTGEKTSQERMPWGGKPPKDTYKHQKGSRVHKIAEGVNFKQMDEETRRNIDELLQELQNDISQYKETGHCSETLKDFLTVHHHGKAQRMAQEAAQAPVTAPVPAPVAPAGGIHGSFPDPMSARDQHAKMNPPQSLEEIDPLEEELAKLAELAGVRMGEESPGEYINDLKQDAKSHGKHEIHAFGQDMPVGEDSHGEYINDLKQDAKSHGKHEIHAFGQDLPVDEAAKLDTVGDEDGDINNDGNKDSTDDYLKNRREKIAANIDESEDLIQMLRIAGLDTQQVEEALALEKQKLKVDKPEDEPANAPKEKHFGMQDQLGPMNTGEGDGGEKNNYGGRGDNPMKQQPNRPAKPVRVGEAATNRLEARLAAEYESIKKVS